MIINNLCSIWCYWATCCFSMHLFCNIYCKQTKGEGIYQHAPGPDERRLSFHRWMPHNTPPPPPPDQAPPSDQTSHPTVNLWVVRILLEYTLVSVASQHTFCPLRGGGGGVTSNASWDRSHGHRGRCLVWWSPRPAEVTTPLSWGQGRTREYGQWAAVRILLGSVQIPQYLIHNLLFDS